MDSGGRTPELCVIFNPNAGKRQGARRLEQIQRAWGARVQLRPTGYPGHAVELARQAALEGIPLVAAAGGDGTAHEVVNGLMQAGRPEVRFSLFPVGSANDYAYSLGLLGRPVRGVRRVDLGRVRTTEQGGRECYFICNLGMGFTAQVTRQANRLRWLQGMALYGLGTLRSLVEDFGYQEMEIQIDEEARWRAPTLLFSVLIGLREGGFVLAPRAVVDDGWFDFIHAGTLSRWAVLRLLPRVALFGAPARYPGVRQGRCRRCTVSSAEPLIVHSDGEFFCLPEEEIHTIEIELLPLALPIEVDPMPGG
jgi:diacylglycerol kinase family enzyme